MRCPHCAGEILDGSRFCGICGRQCAAPAAPMTLPPDGSAKAPAAASANVGRSGMSSMSLFELPVSRGARMVRVFAVLALDAVLVVAGIAMIVSYMNDRDRAASPASAPDAGVAEVRVEAATPTLVKADSDDSATKRAADGARPTKKRTSSKPRTSGGSTSGGRTSGGSTSGDGTSGDGTSGDGTSGDGTSGDGTSGDGTSGDGTSGDGTSGDGTSGDGTLGDELGGDGTGSGSSEPTPDDIRRVARQISVLVDRHDGRLKRCYSQSAKAFTPDDPLVGLVEIQFVLVPGGTVKNVKTVKNTSGSDTLAACVVGLVKSWSFPEPPGSASLPFSWPFNFKAP
jgi:hypothetical protein